MCLFKTDLSSTLAPLLLHHPLRFLCTMFICSKKRNFTPAGPWLCTKGTGKTSSQHFQSEWKTIYPCFVELGDLMHGHRVVMKVKHGCEPS